MAFYYKIPIQLQPIRTYIDTKKETIIILQLQANNVTFKKYWFLPETQYCCSNQIENEMHFLFHCDRYNNFRQQVAIDIIKRYPTFDSSFNNRENNISI